MTDGQTSAARGALDAAGEPPRWRLLPQPLFTLVLFGTWLLIVGSVHPRMLLLGAIFSVAITWFSHRFLPVAPEVHSWRAGLRFIPVFLWDIVVANMFVALLILRVDKTPRSRWLVIPLEMRDPFAMSTLASVISLTPGTVSARFDADRRVLYVHALDVEDPAAEIALIKTRYEAPLREVFEG